MELGLLGYNLTSGCDVLPVRSGGHWAGPGDTGPVGPIPWTPAPVIFCRSPVHPWEIGLGTFLRGGSKNDPMAAQ